MKECKIIFEKGFETAGYNGCIIHDALFHINEWLQSYDIILTTILGSFAVYFTVQALKLTREQSKLAQEQAHEATIINAWNVLTTPAPGNSGKKEAIETLAAAGKSLSGIDLSIGKHKRAVHLKGLNVNTGKQVDLSGADFSGASLWGAIFTGANLRDAIFTGADLRFANFTGANLRNADFTGANLYKANFTGAILRDAIFTGANLNYANFTGANLNEIDFSTAIDFKGAKFENCWVFAVLPILPQGWKVEVVLENGEPKTHKNKQGEVDGYYINIVKEQTPKKT